MFVVEGKQAETRVKLQCLLDGTEWGGEAFGAGDGLRRSEPQAVRGGGREQGRAHRDLTGRAGEKAGAGRTDGTVAQTRGASRRRGRLGSDLAPGAGPPVTTVAAAVEQRRGRGGSGSRGAE